MIVIALGRVAKYIAAIIICLVLLEVLEYLGDVVGVGDILWISFLTVVFLGFVFLEIDTVIEESRDRQFVVLGVVKDLGPCNSLQISLETQRRTGKALGIGALSKTLHDLERKGYLHTRWIVKSEQAQARKRTYEITDQGVAVFTEFLDSLTAKYIGKPGGVGV